MDIDSIADDLIDKGIIRRSNGGGMDTDLIRKFKDVVVDIREREAEVKRLKKVRDELEPRVLEEFAEAGVQSVKSDGVTVYLSRTLWASYPQGRDAAVAALNRTQHPAFRDLVTETVNTNTVSAILRELDAEGKEVPEDLRNVIGTSEKFKAGVRTEGTKTAAAKAQENAFHAGRAVGRHDNS